jgi:hypothetical protein
VRVREIFTIEDYVKNHENLYEQELRKVIKKKKGFNWI